MNATLIVFIPTDDGRLPTQQAVSVSISDPLPQLGNTRAIPQSIRSNQATPPFWTWFIENPRSHAA